jgi:hypothetical protein
MPRTTPQQVARQLRQEAGFGCCACGNPIFEYHHIVRWADDQHFRPEDMMVLCPNHHDMATKGAMPEDAQRKYKSSPRNILDKRTRGILEVDQNYCAIKLGTMTLVNEGAFLRIDGNDLLACYLSNRTLEISLKLYDENDELLVEIERNEWVAGDPLPWDIEGQYRRLTIRERAGKISLSLDVTTTPAELRAQFWYHGKYITCDPFQIRVGPNPVRVSLSNFALVGGPISIDQDAVNVGKEADAVLISWPSERERLWKAKDAWERLSRSRQKGLAPVRNQPL